jgi:rsbT antagonist protein RsbS
MALPIQRQGDVLVVTIHEELDDHGLAALRDALMDQVGSVRARGVVIDVTALDVLDSYATRTLRGIAQASRLRGADTVVVGIQPDVAVAMVQLGLDLDRIATALDLDDGLATLARRRSERRRG